MSDKRNKASFMSRNFPDAKPLQQNRQATEQDKSKPPIRKQASEHHELDLEPLRLPGHSTVSSADTISYQGNGVQNRLMRQLRQGAFAIEDVLDLHGQTVEQAYQAIIQFLYHCQQRNRQKVLIIHGQGYRSAEGVPILKQNVDYWLRQHEAILAFHSATPADGGKGAVYVLLRKGPA